MKDPLFMAWLLTGNDAFLYTELAIGAGALLITFVVLVWMGRRGGM